MMTPRLKLPGFHDILTQCRSDGFMGGVGLFIKDSINFKVRHDLSVFIPHVHESLFIEIISTSVKISIVGIVYRPNTPPRVNADIFSTHLFDTMDIINSERKTSIIMGDFNIDLLKYGIHRKTNDYIDNVFSRGVVPLIHKPTRLIPPTATLIDHIYTNDNRDTNRCSSGVILMDIADHLGTFHLVKNIAKFKQLLSQLNCDNTMDIECPNNAFNAFMTLYKDAFESTFPLKSIKQNRKYITRKPWVTAGLFVSSRTKIKLLKNKLKEPSLYNIERYKTYINIYITN